MPRLEWEVEGLVLPLCSPSLLRSLEVNLCLTFAFPVPHLMVRSCLRLGLGSSLHVSKH